MLTNTHTAGIIWGMHLPHQQRQQRFALMDWISGGSYTHAITLNTDRELTSTNIGKIFSTFCHRFDKRVLQSRNMKTMPRELRLHAIAFPENLSTNAHLHAFADLTTAMSIFGDESGVMKLARSCWLEATKGSGSFDWLAEPDRGWAKYITKRFNGCYFLSADFWPD